MFRADAVDLGYVVGVMTKYLGAEDEWIRHLDRVHRDVAAVSGA